MKAQLGVLLTLFASLTLGKPAPTFQGKLLSGDTVSLESSLKAGKPLLLCFWASWCSPCLEELKGLSKKLAELRGLKLEVLTINVDSNETLSDVKPTIRLYKIAFPVFMDTTHDVFAKYHPDKTLPFSVLIGAKGEILESFSGYQEEMVAKIEKRIKGTVTDAK